MTDQPYLPPVQTDCVVDTYHGDEIAGDLQAAYAKARDSGVALFLNKASQGTGNSDDTYAPRRAAQAAVGLMSGGYHWCTAADPAAQVAKFMSVVRDPIGTALMFDAEKWDSSQCTIGNLIELCKELQRVVGRKLDILYMGRDGPDGRGTGMTAASMSELRDLVTWLMLPEYGSRTICPLGFDRWDFHQYTGDGINGTGYVAGLGKGLDRSYWAGTVDDLVRQFNLVTGASHVVPPAPAVVTTPPAPVVAPSSVVRSMTIRLDTMRSIRAGQAALHQAGLYSGAIDGVVGPQTSGALDQWEKM